MGTEDRIRTGSMDDEQLLDRDEVARLAYFYWEERGRIAGGHDEDWDRAEAELRRRRLISLNQRTVLGVFQSIDEAQRAFGDLEADGFSRNEISLIANKAGAYKSGETGRERAAELNAAAESAGSDIAADAGIGAAIGGVGGLLLSFASLAVPGVGPIVAAGPIIAALGGAGIGAATGGIIGALTETGVPEEAARHYAEGIRRGDVLIAVRAEGARADRAARILDGNGAIDIDDRLSAWRSRGWTGFDPDAQPLSADELRRERQYYAAAREQGREWTQMSQTKTGGGLAASEAKNAKKDAARTSRQADRSGATRIYGRSPS
jgi:hypothetical protein